MEESIASKMRRWTDGIAAGEIAGVIPELVELLESNVRDKTLDKVLLKLLQHLSHGAYKYDRLKRKLGIELARVTSFVCCNMRSVGNGKKFFSSIYHIVACLVEMGLYEEGMEINDYLLPESNLCEPDETITRRDMFEPVSSFWHKVAMDLLKKNSQSSVRKNKGELIARIIKYELSVTKHASDEPSRDILLRVLSHCRRLTTCDPSFADKLKDSILDDAINVGITLNDDKSDDTWKLICELIPVMIGKDVSSRSIGPIGDNYARYFEAFRGSVMARKRYVGCFVMWERLCSLLLEPVDDLTSDWPNEINDWTREFKDCAIREDRRVVRSCCYAILGLLTSVLNYWEEYGKRGGVEARGVNGDTRVVAMLKLCKEQGALLANLERVACRCGNPECRVKTDIANELVLGIKCLSLISQRPSVLELEDTRNIGLDLVETSLRSLETLKIGNCEQWTSLWPVLGAAIYNIGVSCETNLPADSVQFYGSLYLTIAKLEGLGTKKRLWGFEDPLGMILHRLSSVSLKCGKFARAKEASSLNALLSHRVVDSRAYRDWANIKYKDTSAKELTILEYLRSSESPEVRMLNLEDYNLVEVCLREIKALEESKINLETAIMAVIDEMELLKPKDGEYARAVQLLGHHSLNFQSDDASLIKYFGRATLMYEGNESPSVDSRWSYPMIKFCQFVERIREIARKNELEGRSTLPPPPPPTTTTVKVTGSTSEYEFGAGYGSISVRVTSELESCLRQALSRWRELIESDRYESPDSWQIRYTIRAIRIAGEYARLYNFESLERDAWEMTYKLANKISDSSSVVYATSRSLTSRLFNVDWISETDKHAKKLETSEDPETIENLTRYRLCLANFYYETEDTKRADELFLRTKPKIVFMEDFGNFLISQEIEMRHRFGQEGDDQSTYTSAIVRSLYTLLSMSETADSRINGNREKHLYNSDILLDSTNNLALRVNSLLSYREISAHLVQRMRTAENLVAVLRVAECLKLLCHIDLSRAKLDDCEVKLEYLERVLEIETLDQKTGSKTSPCRSIGRPIDPTTDVNPHVDAIRDIGQSDASPILRHRVFEKPDFMLHGEGCLCFKCANTGYQYLVFACTHLRAQLFSLRRNAAAALQYFHGALRIKLCIRGKQPELFVSASPHRQQEAIEYVMFHLDYCRFLDWSTPLSNSESPNSPSLARDALELCQKYNLTNHPIYVSVNEYILKRRFGRLFNVEHFSKFMVPDIKEMDESRYEDVPAADRALCVTPVREILEKRPISVRRRKTPTFLKLDRVPIDPADDESAIASTPGMKPRRLRRKISDDEDYSEDKGEKIEPGEPSVPEIKISLPGRLVDRANRGSSVNNCSDKRAVTGIKNAEVATRLRKKVQRRLVAGDCEKFGPIKKMDEVTELFNDMSVTNKSPNSSDSSDPSLTKIVQLSLDVATGSESEEGPTAGRRASARLRKKSKDLGTGVNSKKFGVPESNSGDEILDEKSARSFFTPRERAAEVVTSGVARKTRNATTKGG